MVALVAHFVEFPPGSTERAMKDHHELAIEGAEEHAVAAVLMDQRGELDPWSLQFAGLGARDGLDVVAAGSLVALVLIAGPEHEQGAVLRAKEFRAVGDVAR